MPFFAPNPNVVGGNQVALPPPPQPAPGSNFLMQQYWAAKRAAPWLFPQGGILNQTPYQEPMLKGAPYSAPKSGLLSPVADIYKFPPKVPGMLGATEGAGGRGLGSRGGGMLGSKWRDPGYIQQYEVQQGLKPGSLQQPTAPVTPIAPQGPQRDFGKYNAKVTDPRMLTPEARRGKQNKFYIENPLEPGKMLEVTQPKGPTPAQMARPVRMTPEIAAKLQAARDQRAARSKVSPLVSKEDREAMRVEAADKAARRGGTSTPAQIARGITNMNEGLWNKMSSADRQLWLRDANWQTWPAEKQRAFIERFMPKGIGP